MSFGEIRLQLERALRCVSRFRLPNFNRFIKMKNRRAGGSETRMREREIWIERDRLCIKLIGFLEIFQQRVRISLDLVRLKISQISVRVFGRLGFKARLFVWTERDAELVCDLPGEFALQA